LAEGFGDREFEEGETALEGRKGAKIRALSLLCPSHETAKTNLQPKAVVKKRRRKGGGSDQP